MNQMPAFQQQQRQFLDYLRQPQPVNLPAGFSPERLNVYIDLLYSKFDESLTACFPIIRSILSPQEWRALLLDFIAVHRCRSPYYRQIPDEFLHYLNDGRQVAADKPFLTELAHFEWVELQLSIAEADTLPVKPLTAAQLLNAVPVWVPVMQVLHYHWPVQDIGPTFQPNEPPAATTHILGFRDSDDQVQFVALNPATTHLVRLLCNGLTGQQALDDIGAGLDEATYMQFMQFGQNTLTELHQRGAIIDICPA